MLMMLACIVLNAECIARLVLMMLVCIDPDDAINKMLVTFVFPNPCRFRPCLHD